MEYILGSAGVSRTSSLPSLLEASRSLLLRLPSPPVAAGAGGERWRTVWVADSSTPPEACSVQAVCKAHFSETYVKSTLKADSSNQNIKNSVNAMLWLIGSHPFFLSRHDILISTKGVPRSTQSYQQVPETESGSFFPLLLSSTFGDATE